MKKRILRISLMLLCVIVVFAGGYLIFRSTIIGEKASDIQALYGEFNHKHGRAEEDGEYYGGYAGYVLYDVWPDTSHYPTDIVFMISFDENGKAYKFEIKMKDCPP